MKRNIFIYRVAQAASFLIAKLIFKRKFLRNEIKSKKGPFVVIANHQCALDFVNLIGATKTPMSFVISNSFYSSLPVKGLLDRMGLIPKQQFQTTVKDMKRMKTVIEKGEPLVIYPAGLMCEDGLSTPIPAATYKFLKWLNADVYVAKTIGTYFSCPKWSKGFRSGRTFLDVYRLFEREELEALSIEDIKQKTEEALLFDAYREQEKYLVKYKNNNNIEGLEKVLYMCPHCGAEFKIGAKNSYTLYCEECGFEQTSDCYGFLHNRGDIGEEVRYPSDWSRKIYSVLKEKVLRGEENTISAKTDILMIDQKAHKFKKVGQGTVALERTGFVLEGDIEGKAQCLNISITNFASLPFSPGKYFEIQQGDNIYRCVLSDGKMVMKFINLVKIFYELNTLEFI